MTETTMAIGSVYCLRTNGRLQFFKRTPCGASSSTVGTQHAICT